ncbi:MAG: glycosyltransferase [Thermoanaerobaculia bacterium]
MKTLFIGITSWNSESFIAHAIRAWARTTRVPHRIVVWDNKSGDSTPRMVIEAGAELVSRQSTQPEAINGLLRMASEEYVLLVHSDVIALSEDWFDVCAAELSRPDIALVSPEDIGCGPYSRPFGRGMPESSFLLFDRRRLRRLLDLRWARIGRLRAPRRVLDLDAPHLTHWLPDRLRQAGLGWSAMNVQPSDRSATHLYGPYSGGGVWSEELESLRYGLGNFYHLSGVVTHYHNWYDRVPKQSEDSERPTGARDFPPDYVRDYTRTFLHDLESGTLRIPRPRERDREPVAL